MDNEVFTVESVSAKLVAMTVQEEVMVVLLHHLAESAVVAVML